VQDVLIRAQPDWVRRWVAKASWAVADQAFFALSQFAMSIMLARWLTPPEYGAYAMVYGVFLFIASLHTSLLTEPMLVFAKTRFSHDFQHYLSALRRAHLTLTGVAGACLLLGAVLARGQTGTPAALGLAALAAAQPLILLAWLYRRACYVHGHPAMAASGGLLHLIIVVAGVILLEALGALSVPGAFLVFGGAGLGASLWLAWRLKREDLTGNERRPLVRREVLVAHWNYGRWSVMTGLISWASYNLYFFLLPAFVGLSATGAFKAFLNLVMPATHAIAALSLLLLPMLSRETEREPFQRQMVRALAVFLAGCTLYGLIAGIFWHPILRLLYGSGYVSYTRYLGTPQLVWLIAFLPVGAACVSVLGSALRAVERPDRVFGAYIFSGIVGTLLGIATVARLGLEGAIIGTALYTCATSLALYWHLRRELAQWGPQSRRAPVMPIASAQSPTARE
jgi:O-antigen/teichoic acid export membrane protein